MRLDELRRFGFLTLPSYSMIACANAIEALRMANRVAGQSAYAWQVVTPDGHPAAASNGLMLTPCAMLSAADRFDAVFVVGGIDVRNAVDRNVTAALRRLAHDGVALGALCTGTFALAEAHLLGGYRCAIHWENLQGIREEFPGTEFVEDFYCIDRDRITCTGGVAPLDLMLVIIQARFGRRVAAQVAAQFLIERGRAADERQPRQASAATQTTPRRLAQALRLIEDSIETPRPTSEIARDIRISTRQLERLFRQHLGISPAAYSSALRLDRARALLRQTALPVTDVGIACGFQSASHFSTAFRARFGHAPRAERSNAVEHVRENAHV
ncbi:MAG: GlxA family transcriptional regulator [Rhodospirillales bacterium]|nr:GlxA family transcriptional regulator [Rhodospirillales bacterium]